MHVLILTQYYAPESVGAAIWIRELTTDLARAGHEVAVLTGFPNYPDRVVFDGYRGKALLREELDGVDVIRTYIYASPSEAMWSRALNFGSFCASSALGGLAAPRPDVIYCIMPPLPLGLSAEFLGLIKRVPVVANVQDIYPDIAVALGILRSPVVIRLFGAIERFVYRQATDVVVISDGFKENLVIKGVAQDKVHVVPNWADPSFIRPGPRDNAFRRRVDVGERFALVYSGNLSHNSNIEPVIGAAEMLRGEPFAFVIVGEGVRKTHLVREVRRRNLDNVTFLPFQPLDEYPNVLKAADMNLVTLSTQASMASVPSKMYKMMASGRPILAITKRGNEVHRLVTEANCGLCVRPDDPVSVGEALRYAAAHREQMESMGSNARCYLEEHFSRRRCVGQIEKILRGAANQ